MNFEQYLIKKGYRSRTRKQTHLDKKQFIQWATQQNLIPYQSKPADLLAYIGYMRKHLKAASINNKLNSIRHYFSYLYSRGTINENPAQYLRVKVTDQKTMHDLIPYQTLCDACQQYPNENPAEQYYKTILGMLVYQGLHSGEIQRLKTTDINLKKAQIYIPPGTRGRQRILPLAASQIMQCHHYLKDLRPQRIKKTGCITKQLFPGSSGGTDLKKQVEQIIRKLNIQYPEIKNTRQVRNSVINHWISTYGIRQAQYMAGHKKISTTERYRTDQLEALQKQLEQIHPLNRPP